MDTLLLEQTITRDAAGQRLSVVDQRGRDQRFRYDAAGRLIGETIDDPLTGRIQSDDLLDALGNRLRTTRNGQVLERDYDANQRLLRQGELRFQYDANGNTVTRSEAGAITRYSYDLEHRLTAVEGPATQVDFTYDSDGNREINRYGPQRNLAEIQAPDGERFLRFRLL